MGPFDQVFQFCNFTIGWLQLLAGHQPLHVLALLVIVAILRTLPSTLSSCQQQEYVGETTNLFGWKLNMIQQRSSKSSLGGVFLVILLILAVLGHRESIR